MGMIAVLVALPTPQLQTFIAEPEGLSEYLMADDGNEPEHLLELDKAWHAIHFVLNGDSEGREPPLADAVLGGEEVGDDFGYGPPRYLLQGEVRAVADALAAVSVEDFEARFDFAALAAAEIYPTIWDREDEEDRSYVSGYYAELREFYHAAAARGDCALLYLT